MKKKKPVKKQIKVVPEVKTRVSAKQKMLDMYTLVVSLPQKTDAEMRQGIVQLTHMMKAALR